MHSLVRRTLYPNEGAPLYHGINLWRGVAVHKPFLTGNSIARIGAMRSTMIIYPIRDNMDGAGNQLVNWVAEVDSEHAAVADWNAQARLEDFYPVYENWVFDWIDVAALHAQHPSDPVLSDGRSRSAGPLDLRPHDAARRCRPPDVPARRQRRRAVDPRRRGARAASGARPPTSSAALQNYEDERRPATARVVLQNRTAPPNIIVDTVEQLTGGKRFDNLEDFITQKELREIFESYQKTAGYHVDIVKNQR